jgi:exopolysaccharide biosynthesis protein
MRKTILFALFAVLMSCSQVAENGADAYIDGATITVTLPNTRTSLGEKVGDNYPVYWSEEDRIVVNGVASTSTAVDRDRRCATFNFAADLGSYPYNVTYPYCADSSCDGVRSTVVFAAEQHFVEGSFGDGYAPMCGYSERSGGIVMTHLAGVLRFAVKGTQRLTKIEVVAADNIALAGEFDVDCQSATIAPIEGKTSNRVTYTVDQQLSSSEAKVFHIVVPAGNLGACNVVLTDSEGVRMTLKWSASDVKQGVVREFKTIAFQPGTILEFEGLPVEDDDLVILPIDHKQDPDSLAFVSAVRTQLKLQNAKGYVVSKRIFGAHQTISVITLSPSVFRAKPVLSQSVTEVSEVGSEYGADFAINGCYWVVSTGKVNSYIKIDGEVVSSATSQAQYPRVNGLLYMYDHGIEVAQSYAYPDYVGLTEFCDNIIACGPVLMDDGKCVSYKHITESTEESMQGKIPFFVLRHPRTIIGRNDEGEIYLIVVDGRAEGNAEGMSIEEITKLCRWLGLTDAMNLDGGGSSTLWSRELGVVNHPCDNKRFDHEGERKVLNSIIFNIR